MLKVGILPRIIEKNTPYNEFKIQAAVPRIIMDACYAFGAVPVMLYMSCGINDEIRRTDGLILPGSSRDMSDPEEYPFDAFCIREYINEKKPVFGICGGMQEIWTCMGNGVYTLTDILQEDHAGAKHGVSCHGKFASEIFKRDWIDVNSFHRLTCNPARSQDMDGTCVSDDGLLEGFYQSEMGLLGVQWHPEAMGVAHRDAIFGFFFKKMCMEGKKQC